MRCLENGDKECFMKKFKESAKGRCHDGNAVGKEVASEVRELIRKLWLVSNHEEKCGLLRMFKDLGVSKGWVIRAIHTNVVRFERWLAKCGISWEDKVTRNEVVKKIEDLLRKRFGWNETWMCEMLWRFAGVDTETFRKYNIEPCVWLEGLEELGDPRNPYWYGLKITDGSTRKMSVNTSRLEISSSNPFMTAMMVSIFEFYNEYNEFYIRRVGDGVSIAFAIMWYVENNEFNDDGFERFIAGVVDGDGMVRMVRSKNSVGKEYLHAEVKIIACKDCPKRANLDKLKEIIAERFGIVGRINQLGNAVALVFRGENAVRLLRYVAKYMHHPLRRIRSELLLAYYDGKISREAAEMLYELLKYKDEWHYAAIDVLVRAAPQTHTHGVSLGPLYAR